MESKKHDKFELKPNEIKFQKFQIKFQTKFQKFQIKFEKSYFGT